ncbi:hypothetical protein PLICRDRAFT_124996 [Plicaturopsis crispa FD-325 SS-3]|nr:hypothetical protein PLICRDRAFT_124996 [Plicaturopsis crispa FD-325 SS-3]
MVQASLKRKSHTTEPSHKKRKVNHTTAAALPWKAVKRTYDAGIDGDDGILELEEVEGVRVVYEDGEGGRTVKFEVTEDDGQANQSASEDDEEIAEERLPSGSSSSQLPVETPTFDTTLLPNWHTHTPSLHPSLFKYLHASHFTSPTPIQSRAVPAALSGKDVVGVAETGSGKTLAYGLPILHHLLSRAHAQPPPKTRRPVRALILAPTRELALQVSSHLNACLNPPATTVKTEDEEVTIRSKKGNGKKKNSGKGKDKAEPVKPTTPPLVSVAAIVGGMSTQKQRRILDRGVDVLVATPGRLWDILEEDGELARELKHLKFLVLDEADRMVEAGHFAELDNILRLTLRQSTEDEIEPDFGDDSDSAGAGADADELQTSVFSATLSKDLQRNLKKHLRPKSGHRKRKEKPASTLDDLLLRLDFRDPDPEVIDISPEGGVVSSLKESKIECLGTDKDVYLYYFLLRYPGRSLVFLSSIDGIRRLMPLMELLNINAYPLHSQLEQRQRLKNLDRFKTTPNAVLLATDIAARGLDIPAVDHVIHYQIPRTADAYVHRNGRTARAQRRGFSMLMTGPDERRLVRSLLGSLDRQDTDIPEMVPELSMLDKLKVRVQLARKIDQAQHKIKKENHDRNWMKEAAEAMELELGSDLNSDSDDDGPSKQKRKGKAAKTAGLKNQLKQLLAQPLIARGVSARYITSGSRPIVDDLLAGQYNEAMVGLKKTEAGSDLAAVKKKKVVKAEVKAEEQYEEWNGIES